MDYAPHTDEQVKRMLQAIGVASFEDLLTEIPPALRVKRLELPEGLTEPEVLAVCERMAARNRSLDRMVSFLGAGAYEHLIPAAVDALAARGEWLTPYTPYQAEASQGTLQAIYEFQTMVCELMQMEVANASLYDGASGVAEAALLALRATGRTRVLVSEALHPHMLQTLSTYLMGGPAIIQQVPSINGVTDLEAVGQAVRDDVACLILQHPNVFGCLEPMAQASELIHRVGGLFIASVYPISLGVLKPPGAYGADIAVAEGRCLGSPLMSGGPGLGLFAVTSAAMRRLPGRVAGCTVDEAGERAYTLTLQTREQHIRREKATSNICTNEGWLALRATIFLSLLGPQGFRELSTLNLWKAHEVKRRLCELPWVRPACDQPFFNEFALQYDGVTVERLNRRLAAAGIYGGLPLGRWFPQMPQAALWCVTELINDEAVERLLEVMRRAR